MWKETFLARFKFCIRMWAEPCDMSGYQVEGQSMLMCSSTERSLNSSERAVPHCNVVRKFGCIHCHHGIQGKWCFH